MARVEFILKRPECREKYFSATIETEVVPRVGDSVDIYGIEFRNDDGVVYYADKYKWKTADAVYCEPLKNSFECWIS